MGAFRFSWFDFWTLFVLSSLSSFSACFFSLISLFTFFSFFFFFSFFAFRSLPWEMPRKRHHVTLPEIQLGNSENHQLIDMEPLTASTSFPFHERLRAKAPDGRSVPIYLSELPIVNYSEFLKVQRGKCPFEHHMSRVLFFRLGLLSFIRAYAAPTACLRDQNGSLRAKFQSFCLRSLRA